GGRPRLRACRPFPAGGRGGGRHRDGGPREGAPPLSDRRRHADAGRLGDPPVPRPLLRRGGGSPPPGEPRGPRTPGLRELQREGLRRTLRPVAPRPPRPGAARLPPPRRSAPCLPTPLPAGTPRLPAHYRR